MSIGTPQGTIGFEEMPLLLPEEGSTKAPKRRLTSVAAARAVFAKMRDDDLVNAANRAECQDMLDGATPWSDQELAEANIDMPNLNFRGAEQQLERAMAPYYRLAASPEHAVKVRTRYGPDDGRQDLNEILSEEITKTLRQSSFYTFQKLLRDQKKIKEGLAVAYFPDEDDWRFRAAGLGQFFFDRGKFVCEEDQEVVAAVETVNVTTLWQKVADQPANKGKSKKKDAPEGDEIDTEAGLLGEAGMGDEGETEDEAETTDDDSSYWNRKGVIAAIAKARDDGGVWNDPEKLTDQLKANDLSVGATSPPIKLIHLWVAEFDGTWSHYQFTEDPCENEDFIYERRGEYESLSDMLTLFPDGIGTNAKIHGMRGLLYKIFPMEQQRNRSLSRFLAAGDLASSLVMACQDEESLANAGLQYFGNMAVIPPGFNASPVTMPNLQSAVLPSIEMMEKLRNDRVAGYTTENVFDGDARKTKFEVAAHLDSAVSLSESQVDLHYLCEDRLARQTIRRMIRRTYLRTEPGGREIIALQQRLLRRGGEELLEAFFRIDASETRAGRAIGDGSAGKRTMALDRMNALRGEMDDTGRFKLDRWIAIDQIGSAAADELFPPDRQTRTTAQTNIAVLENQFLYGQRQEMPVQESDPHLAHAREHIKPLQQMQEAERLGQLSIEEMAVTGRAGWVHAIQHIEKVQGGDESSMAEAAAIRQFLQQVGEPIENGLKEQAAQDAQAAQGEGQEGGQGGPTPEQIAKVETFNEELRQKRERFDLEQDQRRQKAELDNAIYQAKAAAKIATDAKVKAAKTGGPTTRP